MFFTVFLQSCIIWIFPYRRSQGRRSQLQSQAPTPPVGRVEQHAGAISVLHFNKGESRKRGLGMRGSIPIEQHARGINDPRWISDLIGRDCEIVSFCRVGRLLFQLPLSFECFLGRVLGLSADSSCCRELNCRISEWHQRV